MRISKVKMNGDKVTIVSTHEDDGWKESSKLETNDPPTEQFRQAFWAFKAKLANMMAQDEKADHIEITQVNLSWSGGDVKTCILQGKVYTPESMYGMSYEVQSPTVNFDEEDQFPGLQNLIGELVYQSKKHLDGARQNHQLDIFTTKVDPETLKDESPLPPVEQLGDEIERVA